MRLGRKTKTEVLQQKISRVFQVEFQCFFFRNDLDYKFEGKKTNKQNHPNFIVQEQEGILILKKFCEKCFISVTHPMFYMRSVDLNFSSTASGEASE